MTAAPPSAGQLGLDLGSDAPHDVAARARELGKRFGSKEPAVSPKRERHSAPDPRSERGDTARVPHVELPPASASPRRPVDAPPEVRVVRSAKRRKSVSARMVDGVLELRVPMWMSKAEQDRWADDMLRRFAKKRSSDAIDLSARCRELAGRFDLPVPKSVRWVGNQNDRWGSCTPGDGTIRINDRLATMPRWVLDYVLVHELAHLRHPDHGKAFWTTVNQYPRTERARGYLLGIGARTAGPATDAGPEEDVDELDGGLPDED